MVGIACERIERSLSSPEHATKLCGSRSTTPCNWQLDWRGFPNAYSITCFSGAQPATYLAIGSRVAHSGSWYTRPLSLARPYFVSLTLTQTHKRNTHCD